MRKKRKLLTARIKLEKVAGLEGLRAEDGTFLSQPHGPAREILISMGYIKIKEEKTDGNNFEIWELPEHKCIK